MREIRKEVLKRLVLAKALYRAAEAACIHEGDEIGFTMGLLSLHDAAEAGLAAIADHLNAVPPNHKHVSLLDYFAFIQAADTAHRPVPFRTQMDHLNTKRNFAKHRGLLGNPDTDSHLVRAVLDLLTELCQAHIGIEFASISLSRLVRDQVVRKALETAEQELSEAHVRECLESLAYAAYLGHMHGVISPSEWERSEQLGQPTFHPAPDNLDLLAHRIDPYRFLRFRRLTPEVGECRGQEELTFRWNRAYGHPVNWTVKNARWALDFCVDALLKYQGEEPWAERLVEWEVAYVQRFTARRDGVRIWDRPREGGRSGNRRVGRRHVLRTLAKGESIEGWAVQREAESPEWYVESGEIPQTPELEAEGHPGGFGYILKSQVDVTVHQSPVMGLLGGE